MRVTDASIVRRIAISSRVFVGNLSYETSQNDLETLFSQVGPVVEVVLPVDRATDRPRGFAFITFTDRRDADDAMDAMNGRDLDGRQIAIYLARPR